MSSSLHDAVRNNDYQAVKAFLDEHSNDEEYIRSQVNPKMGTATLIYWTVENNNLDIFNLLIPYFETDDGERGYSPLVSLWERGENSPNFFEMLGPLIEKSDVEKVLSMYDFKYQDIVYDAVDEGMIKTVKYLLELYPDKLNDSDGGPLAAALTAEFFNFDIVKYLVEKGADVNGEDWEGRSMVVLAEDLDIVKYLLDNGADPTMPKDGTTLNLAQYLSGYNQNIKIFEYLLERGADPLAVDSGGSNFLHLTINHLLPEDMEIIMKYVKDPRLYNDKDRDGNTPAHMMYYYDVRDHDSRRRLGVLKLLHLAGANFSVSNNEGHSVYYYARRNQRNSTEEEYRYILNHLQVSLKDITRLLIYSTNADAMTYQPQWLH